MTPCEITQDLLPLYIDNTCTEDSRKYVEQHLSQCAECRVIYEAMSKSVQLITTQQNAKKSFSDFQRRLLRGRILLIVLCALIVLVPLGIAAYIQIDNYMYDFHPVPIEPIKSTVSRLSDGSIYVNLKYTDENVYVTSHYAYDHPYEDNVYYIELGYLPKHLFNAKQRSKGIEGFEFLITTKDSHGKYEYSRWTDGAHYPYQSIVLKGPDGTQVIWQEGDEIPAADEKGEAFLKERIESGRFIPLEPLSDRS